MPSSRLEHGSGSVELVAGDLEVLGRARRTRRAGRRRSSRRCSAREAVRRLVGSVECRAGVANAAVSDVDRLAPRGRRPAGVDDVDSLGRVHGRARARRAGRPTRDGSVVATGEQHDQHHRDDHHDHDQIRRRSTAVDEPALTAPVRRLGAWKPARGVDHPTGSGVGVGRPTGRGSAVGSPAAAAGAAGRGGSPPELGDACDARIGCRAGGHHPRPGAGRRASRPRSGSGRPGFLASAVRSTQLTSASRGPAVRQLRDRSPRGGRETTWKSVVPAYGAACR